MFNRDLPVLLWKCRWCQESDKVWNGMELGGHRITADCSITKRPHTPTPGVHMGRPPCGSSGSWGYYGRGEDGGSDGRDYCSRTSRGGGGGGGWEPLKTGIRYAGDGHLLLTVVVEDTDHVPDLHPTHLVAIKARGWRLSKTCPRAGILFVDNIFYHLPFKKWIVLREVRWLLHLLWWLLFFF